MVCLCRDTPVPYPYIAVLNVTTFVFVYCTPFIYLRVGLAGATPPHASYLGALRAVQEPELSPLCVCWWCGVEGTMVGTLLLALCYYGVSMIAVQLEK